jgi:hypothetical protein
MLGLISTVQNYSNRRLSFAVLNVCTTAERPDIPWAYNSAVKHDSVPTRRYFGIFREENWGG